MSLGPLLLVPGLAGSEIYTPPSFFGYGPAIKIWESYALLAAGAWRWLALAPDGVTPTFPGVGALTAGRALPYYYGTLCDYLRTVGWDVHDAAMMWPGTTAIDAATLAAQIQALSADGPVACVAHSRGGLVLREALALLGAAGQIGAVGRCVGLGVPHYGSWEAANLLAGFQQSLLALGTLVALGPYGNILDLIFSGLRTVVRTWPVCYELLPSPSAPGVDPAAIAAIYSAAAWAAAGTTVSQAWLTAAAAAWAARPPVPQGMAWLDVVGSGVVTCESLLSAAPPSGYSAYEYTLAGDGTVPAAWAVSGAPIVVTAPTSHSALPRDGRVLACVRDYLLGRLVQSVTIPGSVLQ